jgi:ubiquinone/menaquinone biosynthesis C-methylase UbiE
MPRHSGAPRRETMTAFQDPTGQMEPPPDSPFAVTDAIYDPETIRLLYARGVDEGWRCLEVGGGSGSVAKWLCSRVGTYGHVVVTDLNTSYMNGLSEPALEIDTHDIVNDPMPERVFHLVHARLVLGELPERDKALERMAASLRSDGWIVVEDFDRRSLAPECDDPASAALFEKVEAAINGVLVARGLDPDYGRKVFRRLTQFGLAGVIARGGNAVQPGGSPFAELLRRQLEELRQDLLSSGSVDEAELERFIVLLEDPDFAFMSPTMVTTWGRRPPMF